jgi:lysophospholipase L1-like esterase
MYTLRILLLIVFCQSIILCSCSQEKKPFQDEIDAYKAEDKKKLPPSNAILFVGSSSIRMWNNLDRYFPEHTVINRGFGGSGLNDAIGYTGDIITSYRPKQIVIYSGENDVASGNVTAKEVSDRFATLFHKIRKELPGTHIVYISMKPSPSREKFRSVIEDGNRMIREFIAGQKNAVYVDIFTPMLGSDNKPRKELFLDDDLHMNEKGYAIWQKAIEPHLMK